MGMNLYLRKCSCCRTNIDLSKDKHQNRLDKKHLWKLILSVVIPIFEKPIVRYTYICETCIRENKLKKLLKGNNEKSDF